MRILAAAAIAAIFVTGPASAQMKTTPAPTSAQPPVQISQPVLQPQASLESARRIKREDAIKLVAQKKAVIVDVRAKEQYDAEHIKGAISIPLMEIISRLKEVPPGKMIITYCA
ncbi:MAG TPA: rhodanese-like domain-containing protein [Thermoanaerobaculia bacterium]|nr:rhodanese-like domain-containing protein [Thermoanaerobaculia bacterium]